MQKNAFERFIGRWLKATINDLDKVIKKELVNQNLSVVKVKTGLATLTIQEQKGRNDQNFSATWIYNCGKDSIPFLRIEWHGRGFNIFTNPPKTRKDRRKEERNKGKIIQMPGNKDLITDAKIEDMEVEARKQEYLDAEKNKPSTSTDKLKD